MKLLEFCFVVYFQYHEITAVQAANKHGMLQEFEEVDSLDDILHHPDNDENHQEEVEEDNEYVHNLRNIRWHKIY